MVSGWKKKAKKPDQLGRFQMVVQWSSKRGGVGWKGNLGCLGFWLLESREPADRGAAREYLEQSEGERNVGSSPQLALGTMSSLDQTNLGAPK